MKTLLLISALLLALPALGETFTTLDGQTFSNATVRRVECDRINLQWPGGLGSIASTNCSPELQKRFGFMPPAAPTVPVLKPKTLPQEIIISGGDTETNLVIIPEAPKERDLMAEKIAEIKMTGRPLTAKVLQKQATGLLVVEKVETRKKIGSHRYTDVDSVFYFLAGYRDEKTVVDDDEITLQVYPAGVFSYESVMGARKTVRCLAATPEIALYLLTMQNLKP